MPQLACQGEKRRRAPGAQDQPGAGRVEAQDEVDMTQCQVLPSTRLSASSDLCNGPACRLQRNEDVVL
eukprot:CAMPEP_0115119752 /NCGR_PEP_ID=MMETSP0227-20121206/45279_1 /TAXON_ID=89957 /ORGANISM="Polarella glacialis, Strain CCMP 1383" /LENGTH=67 /DNA_ID=CAMNT_0002521283 /DNA_START=165 /DNA_END=368 /DNA_ORIENTATION=+